MTASAHLAAVRFVLISLATLSSAGCMAVKPVPPLDEAERAEFAALAPVVAAERIRVVAEDDEARRELDDYVAAIRIAGGIPDADAPSLTLEIRRERRSFCGPMLYVLTLGFFPDFDRGESRRRFRLVEDDGRAATGDVLVESPYWIGWLVGPIALLPGWRLSATWKKEEQEAEFHSDARRSRLALGIARSVERIRNAPR